MSRPKPAGELTGLVWGMAPLSSDEGFTPWFKRPALIGGTVMAVCIYLNWLFW